MFSSLFLAVIAIAVFEFYQYGLFIMIGITDIDVDVFVEERLLPTLIVNLAFAILMLYPLKKTFYLFKKASGYARKVKQA